MEKHFVIIFRTFKNSSFVIIFGGKCRHFVIIFWWKNILSSFLGHFLWKNILSSFCDHLSLGTWTWLWLVRYKWLLLKSSMILSVKWLYSWSWCFRSSWIFSICNKAVCVLYLCTTIYGNEWGRLYIKVGGAQMSIWLNIRLCGIVLGYLDLAGYWLVCNNALSLTSGWHIYWFAYANRLVVLRFWYEYSWRSAIVGSI